METVNWLQQSWDSLLKTLNIPSERSEPIWKELLMRYQESHRQYHNLLHLRHLLKQWGEHEDLMDEPIGVALAIWFHDLIYEPLRPDNEEQSARRAEQILLSWQVDQALVQRVKLLIEDTAKHMPGTDLLDNRLFLDMDLSILGSEPDAYVTYARQIREEYYQLPEAVYTAGRIQVLDRFLQRPFLFFTPAFRQRFELIARQNISNELTRLATQVP
ncbi:MAG: hypothetical protein AAF587_26815 [Bacteroidota bacterium]